MADILYYLGHRHNIKASSECLSVVASKSPINCTANETSLSEVGRVPDGDKVAQSISSGDDEKALAISQVFMCFYVRL